MDSSLRDVTRALGAWLDEGRPAVLATVAASDGSAPRGLGARLAIAGPEEWIGALSGGCTEAAVIAEAERLLAEGDPDAAVLVSYTKETMADVGPVCGATLDVIVERVDDVLVGTLERLVDTAMRGESTALLTVRYSGSREELVREEVELDELPDMPANRVTLHTTQEGFDLTQDVGASIHLVLGGGGDIARELVHLADRLAWRTTIVDARTTLLEQTLRGCTPTKAVAGWSDAVRDELGVDYNAACVALAHESHHDEPFLARALTSGAAYVGAVGSRRVQAERRDALVKLGVDDEQLERLHGPAGLDLGGHAASEIALAIVAEIIAVTNDRKGVSLASTEGPIRAN